MKFGDKILRSYHENYTQIDNLLDEIKYLCKEDLKNCKAVEIVIKDTILHNKIEKIFSEIKVIQNKNSVLHSSYKFERCNSNKNRQIFYSLMIIH